MRLVTTWPRKPRCTLCTSPRPEQVVQVAACVPGAVPAPGAGAAQDGGVDRELLGGAEHASRRARARSGSARRARPACGCAGRASAAPPKNASMMSPRPPKPLVPKPPPPAAAGVERVAAEVDDPALLRVGQRLVGAGDLLEALLGLRVGVDVGVQVAGQPPVGALDLVVARAPGQRPARRSSRLPSRSLSLSSRPAGGRRSGPRRAPRPCCLGSPCGSGPTMPRPPSARSGEP